jgi:urease accessory protein
MLRLDKIVGHLAEPQVAAALHHVGHHGAVEYLTLSESDTQRHRLRAVTDRGTECAIALPRSERLANGAVLLLDHSRAIVVRMQETPWLTLAARDVAAALALGYFAGNMHWKVEFDVSTLRVALDGPLERYLERLAPLMADGRVIRVAGGACGTDRQAKNVDHAGTKARSLHG